MKRKLNFISAFAVALAIILAIAGVNANSEYTIVSADLDTYAASAGTTSLAGFVSEKVDGFGDGAGDIVGDVSDIAGSLGGGLFGGLGDSLGGIGDSLSGLLGSIGSSSSTTSAPTTQSATYAVEKDTVGYITPVPYASESTTVQQEKETVRVNETVDFSATQNPYAKPTGELKGGDTGDGVRWLQWVFIYTRYGLKDDGITGIFDEDTVAVVKKLQKEKGLEVDGIVDSEVIAQIELLYFEAVYGATSTEVSLSTDTDSTTIPAYGTPTTEEGTSVLAGGGAILTIALVLIWIIAIGLIVVLLLIKKKKRKKAAKTEVTDNKETSETDENKSEN